MQQISAAGGSVLVVYLTDGDGYPEAVSARKHVAVPTAGDYRDFGKRRQREARQALESLALHNYAYRFLGFPDSGLGPLLTTYWSERSASFRSPFTRLDRPPRSETIVPDTEYRGEDLTQELAMLIDAYGPTIVAVPRAEDQHPDHCAAWFFVADAIGDIVRVRHGFHAALLTYVIHYDDWPFDGSDGRLPVPHGLSGGSGGWLRVPLSAGDMARKRSALQQYQTQMRTMEWFLDGFARSNELFARPARPHVVLPVRANPCGR